MTYVGKPMFLFSDICFLQMLMVSVTLKDREGQNQFLPLIFTSETLRNLINCLTKLVKYFCLPIQHNVLLLGLHYLASAQFMYSQSSI